MENNDPLAVRFVAGAVAASTAELCTLPLDCSKVRMQTHGMHTPTSVQFNAGLVDTIRKVVRYEGVLSLWKGATPAVIRQVTFYSVSMVLYTPLRDAPIWPTEASYASKLIAGGCSGAIGIALANPLDVVKVKMQNDRTKKRLYRGIGDALKQIYHAEGYRGFLRGISPNIQRCFLVNGVEFGTYDQSKVSLIQAGVVRDGTVGATLAASFAAGFAGAVASSPLDVIKTTLMVHQNNRHYTGVWDCGRDIYQKQGFRAFYKGFTAYYLREAPWCCLFFLTYEGVRNVLVGTRQVA
ncbi:hypothetical protein H310_04855 [Aphanomyces invadans]|uniref:Mitochondrial carrier protein n=1 Tax=Aphanomyces invadans TaxID=157072 RepID=A0A024UB07_9STRA|nr:hypothetical protein H310_04855 [Aphanomyces invadans]ETW03375.1 hypothetical protein H310_04855 [Aphanomyces invadans]|eukprot:XP_008867604.1 hypothetical protein H310_04855 [Aphanomyces invadans]